MNKHLSIMERKDFSSLHELLTKLNTERKAIDYFVRKRWPNDVECPMCLHKKIYKYKDKKRFKCAQCKYLFSYKTGTVMESSNVSILKWIIAQHLVFNSKKGISSYQLAREISVTQKTAWFMLHRIRETVKQGKYDEKLTGVVEIDECFVGGKNGNRHKDKKVENIRGRSFKDKQPVIGVKQRGGLVRTATVPNTKAWNIQPFVRANVEYGSKLMTDEWTGYCGLAYAYEHEYVAHGAGQYRAGDCHTNGMENFWSHLKNMIRGTYHNISRKHMQRYVDEQTFRFNTRKADVQSRLTIAYKNINGSRLRYKDLVNLKYEAKAAG